MTLAPTIFWGNCDCKRSHNPGRQVLRVFPLIGNCRTFSWWRTCAEFGQRCEFGPYEIVGSDCGGGIIASSVTVSSTAL